GAGRSRQGRVPYRRLAPVRTWARSSIEVHDPAAKQTSRRLGAARALILLCCRPSAALMRAIITDRTPHRLIAGARAANAVDADRRYTAEDWVGHPPKTNPMLSTAPPSLPEMGDA